MVEASYTYTLLYYFYTVDTTEAYKKGVLTKGNFPVLGFFEESR